MSEKTEAAAIRFEKRHGSVTFVKCVISSLSKMLAGKGIFTEDELCLAFEREAEDYEKEVSGE